MKVTSTGSANKTSMMKREGRSSRVESLPTLKGKIMKPLTVAIKLKGWTAKGVSERWEISERHMANICNEPKPKDWDAVTGLPERTDDDSC